MSCLGFAPGFGPLAFVVGHRVADRFQGQQSDHDVAVGDFGVCAGAIASAPAGGDTVHADGGGAGSWPITGYTYLILHTTSMQDCTKAQAIVDFIKWAQTDPTAQKAATTLGYSVLPDAVRTKVLTTLGQVTCNGQPLK